MIVRPETNVCRIQVCSTLEDCRRDKHQEWGMFKEQEQQLKDSIHIGSATCNYDSSIM